MKKNPFKYECGHTTTGVIIMNTSILAMNDYIQWGLEEGNLETQKECFPCYLKRVNKRETK